jgi:pimeloyl-ACP methyl ester carboxylesterase
MNIGTLSRSTRRAAGLALVLALTVAVALLPGESSTAQATHGSAAPKPTIVLVHGAFADASGWAGVEHRLQHRGYTVIAPANPLRGVASDAAYVASVLASITGPIVLVGHSYGGEVITNAATGNPNVKALVYIAAFAPDDGETSGTLANKYPGTGLTQANLVFRAYPLGGGGTGTDGYINPAVFKSVFCADVPNNTAMEMAASQRPAELATLSQPSGVPAWRTIPSWYLVANQDRAIPPAVERFMAHRMGAHTEEINSSHVAMISHPRAVTELILDAAGS